jgi:sugar-specific transcriptional regulator TrmB
VLVRHLSGNPTYQDFCAAPAPSIIEERLKRSKHSLRTAASTQNEPKGTAAPAGATAAGYASQFNWITVSHHQLFVGAYLPAAE